MAHNPEILITRPEPQATRFAESLAGTVDKRSISVLPLTKAVYLDTKLDGQKYPVVAFTSENGVWGAARNWTGPKGTAFVVGDRTGQTAEQQGWQTVSAKGTGADLGRIVARDMPNGTLLWPSGRDVRPEFLEIAQKHGVRVVQKPVYEMVKTDNASKVRDLVERAEQVILPVFSPKSAEALVPLLSGQESKIHIVVISPNVAQKFEGIENKTIADEPNGKAMIRAIAAIYPPLAP